MVGLTLGNDAGVDVGPSGLEQPDVIDLVVREKDGTFSLVMRETRPWTGGEEQLAQLRAKVNLYAAYAMQGQLNEDYPESKDQPVQVVLAAFFVPAGPVLDVLDRARQALAGVGVGFDVKVIGGAGW